MTNYIQHIKDLLGMANGLSTEQKHDLVKAGLQAAPTGTAGVGASMAPVTESAFLGFAGLCAVLTLRAARWFLGPLYRLAIRVYCWLFAKLIMLGLARE